jgi:primase-polymerase (primpol)-like protein
MKKIFETRKACQTEIKRLKALLEIIQPDTIPTELRARPQWVCWRYEIKGNTNGTFRVTKMPYQVSRQQKAETDNAATWTHFDNAFAAYVNDTYLDGIGFVFSEQDDYTGIDFDNCRNIETGKIHPTVTDWCRRFGGYAEASVSTTGGHVIIKAKLPDTFNTGFKFTRYPEPDMEVEVYDKRRYFIVTGNPKSKVTEIPNAQPALDALINLYRETKGKPSAETGARREQDHTPNMSTNEIIAKIRQSKQAHKFDALMQGNTTGYSSPSEADFALCAVIAFWTQNEDVIDAIFRQSKLMRAKWDEKHYADGDTYGQGTIKNALSGRSETYSPPRTRTYQQGRARAYVARKFNQYFGRR